jgi:ferredoxin
VNTVKVRVDHELCTGNEICTQVYPEMFEMEGDEVIAKIEEF